MKIMLAVWCFMVFAAVGERLAAVSGKREREREKIERGGLDKEREHLFRFLCIHIFPLAPALF